MSKFCEKKSIRNPCSNTNVKNKRRKQISLALSQYGLDLFLFETVQ